MEKLVVDGKIWHRGKGCGGSLLLSRNGARCIVGIYGRALGISDEKLLDKASADNIDGYPDWLRLFGPCDDIYWVNDKPREDTKIKAEIVQIMAKHNVEVEFINC